MKLKYENITLEEIDTYEYYYFECDGDTKKVIAILKEEE